MSELELEVNPELENETQEIDSPVEDEQVGDEAKIDVGADSQDEAEDQDGEDEIVITLDGEEVSADGELGAESEDDSDVIKQMRARLKEAKRELREANKKAEAATVSLATPKRELRPRPKSADFDFDDDKLADAIIEWHKEASEIEAEKSKAVDKQKAVAETVQAKFLSLKDQGARIPQFDEAQSAVDTALSPAHREALVFASEQPANLVYALGNRPELAKELGSLDLTQAADLISFGKKVASIEGKLKVSTRKPKAAPERKVTGNTGQALSLDQQLEKAQEAARNGGGDYNTVLEIKRQIRKS